MSIIFPHTVYAVWQPRSDIQIYRDKEKTIKFGLFKYPYAPRKTRKYITLNCFRYRLEWIK